MNSSKRQRHLPIQRRLRAAQIASACAAAAIVVVVAATFVGPSGDGNARLHASKPASGATVAAQSPGRPTRLSDDPALALLHPRLPAIGGETRNTSGLALAGAEVCLLGSCSRREPIGDCTVTDARGRFMFDGSVIGGCIVASAAGYGATLEELSPGKLGKDLRLTLVPARATIAGSVLDAAGGVIPGASIIARRADIPVAIGRSDADGRFSLGIGEFDVDVEARAFAYTTATVHVRAPASDLSLVLAPASAIEGVTVAAETDEGIAGITVTATSQRAPITVLEEVSSSDGSFRLEPLPPGVYALSAVGDTWRSEPRWVSVALAQPPESLRIELTPASVLGGLVRVGQSPCSEGFVEVVGGGAPVPLDVQGGVRVRGLRAGRYEVDVHCAGALPLHEQIDVDGAAIERVWELSPGLSVTGRVETATGAPLAGANVHVSPVRVAGDAAAARCTSNEGGTFRCGGLVPGEYECQVIAAGQSQSPAVKVEVEAAAEPSVVLRTLGTGAIRVRIDGPDPSAVSVVARGEEPRPLSSIRVGGEHVFEGVHLGHYSIYAESADGTPSGAQLEAALERPGQTLELVLRAPPASRISGRVVEADGEPALDAWVQAVPSNPFVALAPTSPVLTDAAGAFVIGGLARGSYTVRAHTMLAEGFAHGIESGSTQTLVQLEVTGVLAGTLRTPTGDAVSSFDLGYQRGDGPVRVLRGALGEWALRPLQPGPYRLHATAPGGEASAHVQLDPGEELHVALVLGAPSESAAASKD